MPAVSMRGAKGEGGWVERSDRRRRAPRRDLKDPGARRRRALGILKLTRDGFDAADIAVWFHLSHQQVNNIRRQAERFAGALGYGG